MPDLKKDP
jgi:hypothetical protein